MELRGIFSIFVQYDLLCQALLMEYFDIWKNIYCIFLGRLIMVIFRPAVDPQLTKSLFGLGEGGSRGR